MRPGLNVAGLVGHCAVRFYVMGERAVEEQASDDEKRRMAEIVAHSIDRGAVGFSTNRYPPHVLPDGRSIPGTYADADELLEIAKAVGPRNALMQNVLDFSQFEFTTDLLKSLARTTGSRVLFSFGVGPGPRPRGGPPPSSSRACARTASTSVRSPSRGARASCSASRACCPRGGRTWKELGAMDREARLRAIHDPAVCARLVQESKIPRESSVPAEQMFWMGTAETPDYTAPSDQNLQALADAAGEHWCETFLRLSRESEGKGLFTYRMFNQSLEALRDVLGSERMFPALGDAGAHVSQIMDAGWASFVLSHWCARAASTPSARRSGA